MCNAKYLNPFKYSPGSRLLAKTDPITKGLIKHSPGAKYLNSIGRPNIKQFDWGGQTMLTNGKASSIKPAKQTLGG